MSGGFGAVPRLHGRRVLVAGGTGRALGAITRLLEGGGAVEVFAAEADTSVQDLAERGLIRLHGRPVAAADLQGAWLVVACTGSRQSDVDVMAGAGAAGVPCLDAGGADVVGEAPPGEPVTAPGSVVLVGGGPGDPGLLTVRGRQAVLEADVVVVDRLAPLAVLAELREGVEVIDVAKIPRGRHTSQEEINAVLVAKAQAGHRVVRFKGGDPYVFGRGMEEVLACREAGVPVSVVPGVTSAVAAPSLGGIPVTHRGVVQGFAVVSGHAAPQDPRSTVDWAALSASGVTLVVLMGVETLPSIAAAVVAGGRSGDTPVGCVMDAGLPSQRTVRTSLAALAGGEVPAGVSAPAVTVIGDVAAFAASTAPAAPTLAP